jgi:hypothetical protein
LIAVGSFHRCSYWSTATTASAYTSASYGCYQSVTAPSYSGTTLTLKTPVLNIRGSTTYYTQTYWEATTDIRYQYKIEVYRTPKTGDLSGRWGAASQWEHIMNDVYSNTHTLT